MFMLTAEVAGVKMINVKCDPYKSQEYQELYSFIILVITWIKSTGFLLHRIKSLTSDLLQDLIHDSYDLVVKKLPLKDQKRLKTNNIKTATLSSPFWF